MIRFSIAVRNRLAKYFHRGMPAARAAPGSSSLEPSTMSASPATIGSTILGMSSGSYWPSGCSITTTSASCWSASR